MVEMSNSSVLVDRRPTYSKALQDTGQASSSMTKDSSRYLNGDISLFAKQERSNSVCSTDSHELDNLLEAADKIKDGKDVQKPKKRVRFNMDNNEEFSYSYANYNEYSDEENGRLGGLSDNINFVGYEYMNGNDESDEDEEDEEDEDEEEEEISDNDYDTETSEEGNSHGLGKYGYLVDKSSDRETNNNERTTVNSSISNVNKPKDEINDVDNSEFDSKTINDSAIQLEKMIQSRKEAVEGEIADLTRHLIQVREETHREMERLQNELELRRQQYDTEIKEITMHREEQKRKFEEELEEFQNEKKLEERRQRYYEHEAIITEKEQELDRRKAQVAEQERETREYEEYLNRRHAICNSKEEDLSVLQNELETLSRELEINKERLLNKSRIYQRELDSIDSQTDSFPQFSEGLSQFNDVKTRKLSRVSTASSRGVDLRIEELKSQNKQLLEELFSLKKELESKDEEFENVTQTMNVLGSENKRLQQKVKNLESQLELARKSAEFRSETPSSSAIDILHRTVSDMRNARVSRVSRVHLEPITGLTSSHTPLSRTNSGDSQQSKAKSSNSSDSGKSTGVSANSSSLKRASSKTSDEKQHTVKSGQEKTTSSLCVVM